MEIINTADRSFIVKSKHFEHQIDNIDKLKKKYRTSTILKRKVNFDKETVVFFVDEIKNVEFKTIEVET